MNIAMACDGVVYNVLCLVPSCLAPFMSCAFMSYVLRLRVLCLHVLCLVPSCREAMMKRVGHGR